MRICDNPQCENKLSKGKSYTLYVNGEERGSLCSVACWLYTTALLNEGSTRSGMRKWISEIHPVWIKRMPFLSDWELGEQPKPKWWELWRVK